MFIDNYWTNCQRIPVCVKLPDFKLTLTQLQKEMNNLDSAHVAKSTILGGFFMLYRESVEQGN